MPTYHPDPGSHVRTLFGRHRGTMLRSALQTGVSEAADPWHARPMSRAVIFGVTFASDHPRQQGAGGLSRATVFHFRARQKMYRCIDLQRRFLELLCGRVLLLHIHAPRDHDYTSRAATAAPVMPTDAYRSAAALQHEDSSTDVR